MNAWSDDLRLIATLVANALLLAAAWRVARRANPRAVVALPDALLLWLAAQYAIVGVCGMLGVLWPGVVLAIACAVSLIVLLRVRPAPSAPLAIRAEDRVVWIALAFVVCYGGALLVNQRWLPALATDALVYHLPAAAQWVQAGRITLVDLWYWLPANSYSPLAGSAWIAWWLAPIGNDSLARFVQVPAWVLMFAAVLRMLRDVRASPAIAAIAAVAVVVARPFASQVTITKDDVIVAALAIVLLGGLCPRRLRERVAPYRLGLGFGLLLSTKYPSLLALPALAPAIFLMRWQSLGARGVAIAGTLSAALVAPWLARNALVTGNPVYPFFAGGGGFVPDPSLRSARGLYEMLAGSFHSLPLPMWLIACASATLLLRRRRAIARDGVLLSLIVGPPLAIAVLVLGCPFAEVRYLFTAIAALLAMIGVAIASTPVRAARVPLAAGVLLVSIGTSFAPGWLPSIAGFAMAGVVGAIVVSAIARIDGTMRRIAFLAAGALSLGAIYVRWPAYLRNATESYEVGTAESWRMQYGARGTAWAALRANVPAGSTIAYVNTPTTWPLFGFDLQFRVVHATVRPGVTHLHDLPPIRERVPARDEYIVNTRLQTDGADAATWLANLDRLRVDYVYAAKDDASNDAPEFRFVREHAERFERVFDDDTSVIWRVRR